MSGRLNVQLSCLIAAAALSLAACGEDADANNAAQDNGDACPAGQVRNPISGDCQAPSDNGSANNTSANNASANNTTANNTTANNTSANNTAVNNASTNNTSMNNGSMNNTSANNTSANNTSTNNASTNNTSANNTSANNTSANNTSANNTSANNTSTPTLYVGADPIYQPGGLAVTQVSVEQAAPAPLEIWTPSQPGAYAVVVFQHGFLMKNIFYSDLLERVASHGFVVVAPQMYDTGGGIPTGTPSTPEEATLASQVWGWLPTGLAAQLPAGVVARTDLLGVVGHSRGSKVIWTVLGQSPMAASAVVGLDPVDGTGGPLGGEARILASPVTFTAPSLIIGTGLGPQSSGPFQPACAPDGDNHVEFYAKANSPSYHIVATQHGHMDMLDDTTSGCGLACGACPSGPDRATMRAASAGWIVALMRGALQGDAAAYGELTQVQSSPAQATTESK